MPAVWINEFHYDNNSTDAGEYVEIAAAAGTDLTGWSIVLYNGSGGASYNTLALSGTVPPQQNGFGTVSFIYPVNGIQNGSPDGIALVDPLGHVVEFISYEGVFTATNGPALGMTSVDVGVSEPGNADHTAIGRVGTGDEASDFGWAVIGDDTPGAVNDGQSFGSVVVERPGAFSIGDAVVVEGDSGNTAITFTVSRGADSNVAADVSYSVTLPGGADGASGADFVSPTLAGTLSFSAGEFSRTITLQVAGDTVNEADETFTVTLSGPTGGATLADGEATGKIANDDLPVGPGTPFINEIHYDNAGTDAGERIEIAAPVGTNLAGWSLVTYSVSTGATQGTVSGTRLLSGIVVDQDDGYGTLSFTYPVNGIQNGPQDGVALVDPDGNVVQFLSYEGSFTAANGVAAGMTTTDIGVAEDGSTPTGFSLQLTGSGASYADFSWADAGDDSFGAVNAGQDFIGPDATGLVRVGDAQVIEGDSGETMLVFTVNRAGGLGRAAGVDWLLNLVPGGADAADLGAGQPLSGHVEFGVGVSSVEVAVAIAGDGVGEGNETLNLLLANPAGNIVIDDGAATGTIVNDDPIALAIYEIQGEGHASDYQGQTVLTHGVVTAVTSNGFYLQDAAGDGNRATSDAIFVHTGAAPGVVAGDGVAVRGTVAEFLPGNDSSNLTVTEIEASNVVVESTDNALPAAVVIGEGGLLPPTEVIDDDGLTTFEPVNNGLDFYESLEGMRVTIDAPLAISNTTEHGETYVVASGGAFATGLSERWGLSLSDGDYNPERIQIDATSSTFEVLSQGDRLADVTGVMSYSFNSYELLVSEAVTVTDNVTLEEETTTLAGDRDHLTVASYNVENMDLGDAASGKFDLLAGDIVYSLGAPDIIALQEVQDANGLNGSDALSGVETAQLLIDAIAAKGGPTYVYVEIAPTSNNSTGGEPNGNIRNGYLYNPDRVDYVDGSAHLIDASAFDGSRSPLVADFTFNGETVTLINVHLTSRIGSDPLWGSNQPPADAGDATRTAQAAAVAAYVNDALAADPTLKLGVLGDFNGFWFEDAVGTIEATGLMDLHRLLAESERYSYVFDGNLQAIDHMLVSGGLQSGAQFDAVHINAEQPDGTSRGTDHDPIVGSFYIEHPNEAPVGVDDAVAVDEDGTSDNLWSLLLGNDTDPDPEDVLAIQSVDGSGALGSLVFDAESHSLVYVADGDAFDRLAPGETAVDHITHTVTDPDGLTSTATVEVTVTGVDDGLAMDGGNGADRIIGTAGEDWLGGGNGDDRLSGHDGHDVLDGGNGADFLLGGSGIDRLTGGRGDDRLDGGDGTDLFVFGKSGGSDVILAYEAGDQLLLEDGIEVKSASVADSNGDGTADLTIAFSNGGGSVVLLGVASLAQVDFAGPADLSHYPPF